MLLQSSVVGYVANYLAKGTSGQLSIVSSTCWFLRNRGR